MMGLYEKINVETEIMDASPHRLIQISLEKCAQHIQMSRHYMEQKDIVKKCQSISKAMDIAAYLRHILNKEDTEASKLSDKLEVVYSYIDRQLLMANMKNDPQYLDAALHSLMIIKSAWDEIGDKVNAK